MDFWKNKVAIVTGAGHGIGAAISEDLAKIGMTVIGFEPTEHLTLEMFGNRAKWGKISGQLVPCKCDVSSDEDLKRAFEGIVEAYKGVDLLVNNAAIGKAAMITSGDIEDFKKTIDVNIYGLVACTRFAIDSMKRNNKRGLIINVNSICGHYMPPFAEPKINLYVTSKRFMTAFNNVIRDEVTNILPRIRVSNISPGIVKTGLFKKSGVDFLDEDFFEQNPYLSTADVSAVLLMVLKMPLTMQVNEILFHALHEVY